MPKGPRPSHRDYSLLVLVVAAMLAAVAVGAWFGVWP